MTTTRDEARAVGMSAPFDLIGLVYTAQDRAMDPRAFDAIASEVAAQINPADRDVALLEALAQVARLAHANRRFRLVPLSERLLSRSEQVGDCTLWRGKKSGKGYGWISVNNRDRQVHRVAYETFIGPIPDGLVIDHVCHTRDLTCRGGSTCPHRACINPDHLEAITSAENTRRGAGDDLGARRAAHRYGRFGTHCRRDHEFTPENTYNPPGRPNSRICKICAKQRQEKHLKGLAQKAA